MPMDRQRPLEKTNNATRVTTENYIDLTILNLFYTVG